MRVMVCVIDDHSNSATPEEMRAIDEFNERLMANGHWVLACGLQGPDQSILIDGRGAEANVEERPLSDSREYVSGFWIMEAPDLAAARALAVEASSRCNRRVELRPLIGSSDA